MEEEVEFRFLDYLEEFRWHLIRSLIAVIGFTIFSFMFIRWIFENIILAPAKLDFPTFAYMCRLGHLTGMEDSLCVTQLPFIIQSRDMTGQFMMSITASFVLGLILAFPYLIWEIWNFIKPAMEKRQRKFSKRVGLVGALLFFLGVLFGYYLLCPMTIWFLANYTISNVISNEFDITSFVSTISGLVLGCGLLFEFPIVIYFLSKMGIVTPKLMRKYRRHSIVVILVLAAVITPTADPFTLTLFALPLYLLFEISIMTSSIVEKKHAAEDL